MVVNTTIEGMELDTGAVRAFVRTADLLHFGNAAGELGITQQALSKRIRKLEATLGAALFERTTRMVTLTPTGERFLLPARAVLDAVDVAVAAAAGEFSPIRVDVLAEPLAPTLMVDQLAAAEPDMVFERSARRGVAAAVAALLRGEIDLAFGRLHGNLGVGVTHRLIRSEPLLILVPHDHPLAGHDVVKPADLAVYGLWTQAPTVAAEWSGFASDLADDFGCRIEFAHVDDVDADYILSRSANAGPAFLTATDVANSDDARLRSIDLTDPTPAYPWSLIWRANETNPRIRKAITSLTALADQRGWHSNEASTLWSG